MSLLIIFVIAISLSMDAFSLSIAYGTLNMTLKQIKQLSLIVGIYHFFMPLVGMYVGETIINFLPVNSNFLVFTVLFIIGIQMIIESFKKDKDIKYLSLFEMFIFGLAVSIDSFTVGIGLKVIYKIPFIPALIFSLTSFLFTFIGLKIGKKINDVIGFISTIIGGSILVLISILYLI